MKIINTYQKNIQQNKTKLTQTKNSQFQKVSISINLIAVSLFLSCVSTRAIETSNLESIESRNDSQSIIAQTLEDQIKLYEKRYPLLNSSQKLVDNVGEGFEELYGVRNFRVVLKGLLYRGGANNYYNKYDKRDNQNPLPTMGLNNLCKEGFKKSIYLYETNFSTAPKQVKCQNFENKSNQLEYQQLSALSEKNTNQFLQIIFDVIKGKSPSPVYIHCWNGWHASGLVSTLALRQFCGLSADAGLKYWLQNTDGNTTGYTSIKNRILNFKPLSQFKISDAEKKLICPLL